MWAHLGRAWVAGDLAMFSSPVSLGVRSRSRGQKKNLTRRKEKAKREDGGKDERGQREGKGNRREGLFLPKASRLDNVKKIPWTITTFGAPMEQHNTSSTQQH